MSVLWLFENTNFWIHGVSQKGCVNTVNSCKPNWAFKKHVVKDNLNLRIFKTLIVPVG